MQHKLQITYPQFNGTNVLAMLMMPDPSNIPVQELIEREQMIFNENKLLEVRRVWTLAVAMATNLFDLSISISSFQGAYQLD